MKTYVLTVSRFFPTHHYKKGQETLFVERITAMLKIHTIRGNYNLWKSRIDEVNEGKAIISLRYWSGRPYNSKQVEFDKLTGAWIQYIKINFDDGMAKINGIEFPVEIIASNDGLSKMEFEEWFKAKKQPVFEGCVIHFTNFVYC